jgi:hypothetical protein
MERREKGLFTVRLFWLLSMTVLAFWGCGGREGGYVTRGGPPPDVMPPSTAAGIIIDHSCTKLDRISEQYIQTAKAKLHIAYGHTSHGSQLVTGMEGLIHFKGPLYSFNKGGYNGALDLRDSPFLSAWDLGNPDRLEWEKTTRAYLNSNPEVNVIIWSWCGQVDASKADINLYLNLMNGLERDYPNVKFVYMTGHLNGTGLQGNVHKRNEQIRDYCRANHKILYDFADIEAWNPDGFYFGDKYPSDNCDYSSPGGKWDRNWAVEWQKSHIEGTDWYNCESAHSQPLNANLKAYAAWCLWARLAGWDGQ